MCRRLFIFKPWISSSSVASVRNPPIAAASGSRTMLVSLDPFRRFIAAAAAAGDGESKANPNPEAIAYLVGACNLPPELVNKIIPRVDLSPSINKRNPEHIVKFFRSNGFTETQISKIILNRPAVLLLKEDTLKLKVDYFRHLFPNDGEMVAKIFSRNTAIFMSSLGNRIVPNVKFLQGLLRSERDFMMAVGRTPWLLHVDMKKNLKPNIDALLAVGIPESVIVRIAKSFPNSLLRNADCFREAITKLKGIGFDPSRPLYADALRSILSLSSDTWQRKFEVYRRFGLSDGAILSGFEKFPAIMLLSEERIKKFMSFYLQKLNWMPEFVFAHPTLLTFSLEKKILPRIGVIDILMSKGLVKKNQSLLGIFCLSNKRFTERFVLRYQEECPELAVAEIRS